MMRASSSATFHLRGTENANRAFFTHPPLTQQTCGRLIDIFRRVDSTTGQAPTRRGQGLVSGLKDEPTNTSCSFIFYPLSAPTVIPFVKYCCKNAYTNIVGAIISTNPAKAMPQSLRY